MPAIGDLAYGYDASGLDSYLEQLKTEALQNAKDAVMDTSTIESTCDNEWEGKSKDNFKSNLKKDAQHVSDQFDALYEALQAEVSSLEAAMANKDEELIQAD